MILWRISNHGSLDGTGGLRASGRWHRRGRRVVYFATSAAGALVEHIVHLEMPADLMPDRYHLMKVEAAPELGFDTVDVLSLPPEWTSQIETSRSMGDQWLDEGRSPLLAVPSAIVPETTNVLLNPGHPDAGQMRILWHQPFALDRRLMKSPGHRAEL